MCVRLPMKCRGSYILGVRKRFSDAEGKAEKTVIIEEVVAVLNYHRKYAIHVLNASTVRGSGRRKRKRSSKYLPAKPVILKAWEALDFPCAERLHPVLAVTADLLAQHGEVHMSPEVRLLVATISRPTLARLLSKSRSTKAPRLSVPRKRTQLEQQVPIERYASGELRPGALEIDLVEHNGGSSLGHFAYTLSVVDVATGYSRRRAILGKGQTIVHKELAEIILNWPYAIWGIHTDNGAEFLNHQLIRFCKDRKIAYTRSRPYKKNDNPHVEQKNFQHVRRLVGYERYDTPEQVEWMNKLYDAYDLYVNLFQPSQKLISKDRHGSKVKKRYDAAKTPLQRAIEAGVLSPEQTSQYRTMAATLNPLALYRQLEAQVRQDPEKSMQAAATGKGKKGKEAAN